MGLLRRVRGVPEASVALMPAKLLFEEAAAVPLAALTAYQALLGPGRVRAGKTVLVHAAAGGVGPFRGPARQASPARACIGTGRRRPTSRSCSGSGADAGIDYTREDFREALRRIEPGGVDVVLDAVGGETLARSYEVVKPGGRLVGIVDRARSRRGRACGHRRAVRVRRARRATSSGAGPALRQDKSLRVHVQKILPLAQAAEAHRALESRHVQGKLVLAL